MGNFAETRAFNIAYLEQAEAHAEEGPIGEPAARSILALALKYARQADALCEAGSTYQRAVERVFEIDPKAKMCFAEGGPTKDAEVYDRFIELNDAGKAFSLALGESPNA